MMVPRELLDLDLEPSIGAKIKKIRTARGMTIRTLASESGFSPSFISQFENGHTNASIGTLRILSTVLGLSFLDLFEPDVPTGRVLRKADRPMLPTAS
jgi:transcriptional regulator with XRE-family HTH domain